MGLRAALGKLFNGLKSAPGPAGRLPLPRNPGRASSAVLYQNGQFSFRDFIGVNLDLTPIKPEEAGDIALNPLFAIALAWICTSWHVATVAVGVMKGKLFEPDPEEHPLVALLRDPNPTYPGLWLMWAILTDYWRRGNAYIHIVRMPGTGEPLELNYLPARYVKPIPDAKGYLDHYEYAPESLPIPVPSEEVIHFRFGIDPVNPLLGTEPLASGFREFVTDNSASNYQAGLFKNGGVPPIVLSPKLTKGPDGEYNTLTTSEAQELTEQMQDKLRNEPGRPRFVSGAVDMHQLAIEPDKMAINEGREEPETRIAALFQIPAVVLGFRAGLLKSTYNNLREAKAAAWSGNLIPTQDYFAQEMTRKLLPLYPDSQGKIVAYDRSNVEELQEDVTQKRKDARDDFAAGILTVEEARSQAGLETPPEVLAELQASQAQAQADAQALQDVPAKSIAYLKRWGEASRERRKRLEMAA